MASTDTWLHSYLAETLSALELHLFFGRVTYYYLVFLLINPANSIHVINYVTLSQQIIINMLIRNKELVSLGDLLEGFSITFFVRVMH